MANSVTRYVTLIDNKQGTLEKKLFTAMILDFSKYTTTYNQRIN